MQKSQGWKARSAWVLFVCLLCGHFVLVYGQRNLPFLNNDAYSTGTAILPYQGRVLMAWVLGFTAHTHAVATIVTKSHGFLRDGYEVVTILCNFIGLWIAIVATAASIRRLTGDGSFARWSSLAVIWMAYFNLVLPYGLTYSLPYDVPSLAFFAVGLMLVVYEKPLLLLPLVAVATLNRETICFVALFYAAWEWWRLRAFTPARRITRIAPWFIGQAAVWLCVKLWLHHRFIHNATEGNGSGLFQHTLIRNVHFVLNPMQWPLLCSVCGFLWIFVLANRRGIRHQGIEFACKVVLPLWVVAMMCVGIIVEIRVFDEMSAVLALPVALILFHRWRERSLDVSVAS